MSDAVMMGSRAGRGRVRRAGRGGGSLAPGMDNGWIVREGPISDHYRVWPLIASVLFPCFGTILVGFDFGAAQWLMVAIRRCDEADQAEWCTSVQSNWELAAILETTCSIMAMFTCIVMYFVGKRVGGRTELLIASMCFTIGSTIEAESGEITRGYAGLSVLFVGRSIYGVGIGMTMHSIPTFIAEISPSKLRGALTGFIEVSLTIGIIYGYAVGMWLYEAFPTGYSWKYTFKFATIFGVGMFFGMLYLPESPRWLVSAGRPLYEALEAAQFINSDLTSDEIVNMKKEIERQVPTHLRDRGDASLEGVEAKESPARRLFCSATMRIPMIVGMGLIIGQQVTGLPAMLYYCVDIFAAVASGKFMWALGSFGAAKLLGSIAVMIYIDSAGRRIFLISGLLLMFASSGALFMLFYDSLKKDKMYQWAFVVLLDLFVIGFEFSVGCISFILLGEIFPGDLKSEALSIAFIASFSFTAAMTFLMYYEINNLGYSTVWGQLSVTAFIWLFFAASMVPETKGKTLEEIQKEFLNDYDVPDFLAAADYFSGNEDEGGDNGAAAASGLQQELGILPGGTVNASEREGFLQSSQASREGETDGANGDGDEDVNETSPMHTTIA